MLDSVKNTTTAPSILPGIFQETFFTRQPKAGPAGTVFLRPIHPKTEIRPTSETIAKVLASGWVGQLKIHGHRAQIHLSANPRDAIVVYNRQGQLHKLDLPETLASELRRIFAPQENWNILDAEWLKPEGRLFVFDFLKKEGQLLHRLPFLERWKLLPRAYLSPCVQTLGVFTTLEECLTALAKEGDHIEGLVFKSSSPGFEDSSIIRCRRKKPEAN